MHLSFHIISCPDPLPSLTKRRPLAELGNRAPRREGLSLETRRFVIPAYSFGSRASSGVKMAQSGPGDRENISSSEMELEDDQRGVGKKWVTGMFPG